MTQTEPLVLTAADVAERIAPDSTISVSRWRWCARAVAQRNNDVLTDAEYRWEIVPLAAVQDLIAERMPRRGGRAVTRWGGRRGTAIVLLRRDPA